MKKLISSLNRKLISIFLILIIALNSYSQNIEFDDEKWTINDTHIIENFKGYKSLYLQGGNAYLKDANFENGIIEYDAYLTKRVAFAGLIWHMKDNANYDEFYIRSHHSGHPDAYQYTPVFNAVPAWQLYHDPFTGNNNGLIAWKPLSDGNGYNGVLEFPLDQWVHFKYIISGKQAEVYINNETSPSVFIKEMVFPNTSGGIGIRSSAGPTHFANFSYQKIEKPILKNKGAPTYNIKEGTIMNWKVSNGFNNKQLNGVTTFDKTWFSNLKWSTLHVEKGGFLHISRLLRRTREINTVLVSFTVNSEKNQTKKIEFGFSDRVSMFVNNKLLFEGTDTFRSRDYRYLGTIGYYDAIYVQLKKGVNTIYFSVSETFGGWGIQARFSDLEGLSIN